MLSDTLLKGTTLEQLIGALGVTLMCAMGFQERGLLSLKDALVDLVPNGGALVVLHVAEQSQIGLLLDGRLDELLELVSRHPLMRRDEQRAHAGKRIGLGFGGIAETEGVGCLAVEGRANQSIYLAPRLGDRDTGITGARRHEDARFLRGEMSINFGFRRFGCSHPIFSAGNLALGLD